MKIGIISDSHTKTTRAKKAIDMLIENGAEFIIHAGDIVDVETLEILKHSGVRYVAVYGNNDAHLAKYHTNFNLVQEPHYFKLADTKFKLMHLPFYMSPDADVVIYGHTHTFDIDFKGKTLFLNPGEVCARNKPVSEWVMLEVNKSEFLVTRYTQANKSEIVEEEHFKYER